MLGMGKRGDSYLRTVLMHGARSVIYRAGQKADSCNWVNAVVQRRNKNVAAVALVNKNARIVWSLLAHDRRDETGYSKVAEVARSKANRENCKTTSGRNTTDCSGEHEVMVRQVRPWLTKPVLAGAPRVRVNDRGVNQQIPSGTAAKSCTHSPNVREQSSPSRCRELRGWHRGQYGQPHHLDGRGDDLALAC